MKPISIRYVEKFPEPEFTNLWRTVFAEVQRPSVELEAILGAESGTRPSETTSHWPMVRLGAYADEELVGWSYGWMERNHVYYMANSGVVSAYRRRGIYSSLLSAMRAHAHACGAVAVRSQHSVLNNAVIIAKLQAGFHISGLSQSAQMGTLVEMIYHLSEGRQEMFRARSIPYATIA